jgi:TolB-like protein
MKFKGEHREKLPEIARALKVNTIVEGSALRVGDKVRITAQLIDAPSDKHLWHDPDELTFHVDHRHGSDPILG